MADADRMWTFRQVEDRLVEAWDFLCRLPDREAGWLRLSISGLWQQIIRQQADYRDGSFAAAPRVGLRAVEVDRMDEALGWLDMVRPADRMVIGHALPWLSRGAVEVPWMQIAADMGWAGTPDALRMRYGRAVARIAMGLSRGRK